jgi:hypothetical protein
MGDDASVHMAQITQPGQTLMVGEQWRTWNKLGSESAQNSDYGYTLLKESPDSGWYASLKCHGDGDASLLMADGAVHIMNGKTLLEGSLNYLTNRFQGSWLDHTK